MSRPNPRLNFRQLKAEVPIGRVLSAYALDRDLRGRGDQLHGPCPLHGGDNSTAFRVHLRRGVWNCFTACGGGDIVELIRRLEGCSYAQAAHHLSRIAGGIDSEATTHQRSERSAFPSRFQPFRRRISLQPRVPFLQEHKGITVSTAVRHEAGIAPRSPFLNGTVAVRLHDLDGHPLGYCGRRLEPDAIARTGKWRFPAHFPKASVLYNAHRARPARTSGIVVVECPWAVMRLVQAGIPGAVALLGTQLTSTHRSWLASAPAVLLLLDGDPAGRKATETIASALCPVTQVHIHHLPDGHEPEDLSDPTLAAIVGGGRSPSFFLNQCPSHTIHLENT